MATAPPSMDVGEEVTCPICMEYMTDPMSVDCGHSFCRGCISRYCEAREELDSWTHPLECPLCKARIKRGNFRPNWQLANVVEKIKCLSLNQGKEDLCARPKEKRHLSGKEEKELERSPEHQSHTVLLLEEAAKICRGQFDSCLEVLRRERERILADKAGAAMANQDMLSQIDAEKTKTKAVFHQLHQFLEEQKALFLGQMEQLEKEIEFRRDEHMARLLEELSSLEGLIQHVEEKREQPARELLQDAESTLQRCKMRETFEIPVAFPPALKWMSLEICEKNFFLESVIKQFKGSLASGSQLQKGTLASGFQPQKANVTLDPETAHPLLILSEDCKSVRCGDKRQALPRNPERFDSCTSVLGREGFTAGEHVWEVTAGSQGDWAVGVARKSVRRKGWFDFKPEEGIWAVEKRGNCYFAPPSSPLSLRGKPKRIKVTLNVAAGRVAFFDADTGALLCVYPEASFSGETLVPFFRVFRRGCLTLPP